MRLLLDECVPRPLKHDLSGHDVEHVVDMGWSAKRNGELLALMVAERFDAFLTVDQNIAFQQNLSGRAIRVVVVRARTNRLSKLRPLVPLIPEALAKLKSGELLTVGSAHSDRSRR